MDCAGFPSIFLVERRRGKDAHADGSASRPLEV
jgi:hypothetical protein